MNDLAEGFADAWRLIATGDPTLLWDARVSLATAVLAGFGRASAEVGAIIIVGGTIAGYKINGEQLFFPN